MHGNAVPQSTQQNIAPVMIRPPLYRCMNCSICVPLKPKASCPEALEVSLIYRSRAQVRPSRVSMR